MDTKINCISPKQNPLGNYVGNGRVIPTTRQIRCLLRVIFYFAPSTYICQSVCLSNITLERAQQNLSILICMPVLKMVSTEVFSVRSCGVDEKF